MEDYHFQINCIITLTFPLSRSKECLYLCHRGQWAIMFKEARYDCHLLTAGRNEKEDYIGSDWFMNIQLLCEVEKKTFKEEM